VKDTIPLFGLGLQGKSPNVSAQQRINCYLEVKQQDADRSQISVYGTPGLDLFVDFGDTPIRGIRQFPKNSVLYVVHRGTLWEVNNAGVATNRGTLSTTTGQVSIDDNGTQVMIVDGTYGYTYNTSTTTFAKITDADFPANPTTVVFHNGRFLVTVQDSGQFQGSASYDGTAWDPLDFATAESNPDNTIAVATSHGDVVLFGDYTTEFWGDTGLSGFPYQRIPGAITNFGLAARWSVAMSYGTLCFLARNTEGQVIVARLAGYQAERISNTDLEHLINGYSSVSDAVAYGYMLDGHPMYVITFPSAGYTWMYDAATGEWSQLKSTGLTRHRGQLFANFLNKAYVSDYSSGKLYRYNTSTYSENGDPLPMTFVGRHIFKGDDHLIIDALQLDVEAGVGIATGQGSSPRVMMQVSKDGGHTWGTEIWAPLGKAGETTSRALWRRLGRARDWTFKFTITDPVKRVLTGAAATIRPGIS